MKITWNELTVAPGKHNPDDLLSEWRWLLGDRYQIVLISSLGDLLYFLRHPRAVARQFHPEDIHHIHQWRLGLRTRDRAVEQQLSPNDRNA